MTKRSSALARSVRILNSETAEENTILTIKHVWADRALEHCSDFEVVSVCVSRKKRMFLHKLRLRRTCWKCCRKEESCPSCRKMNEMREIRPGMKRLVRELEVKEGDDVMMDGDGDVGRNPEQSQSDSAVDARKLGCTE